MFRKIILAAAVTLPLISTAMASESHKTLSVSGATSVDEVVKKLNEKAHQMGADSVKITFIGGNNKMFGTAVIDQK